MVLVFGLTMQCFEHDGVAAVGICSFCQKAMCRQCVGREAPRLMCRACLEQRPILGYEYRSELMIGSLPLLHVCGGIDPVTMRPKIAKGVIAIGNIAVGGIAIGGLAIGLITLGGASLGLLFALGGAAIGGGAYGPATIDGRGCDPAAVDFVRRWLGSFPLPPNCRGL